MFILESLYAAVIFPMLDRTKYCGHQDLFSSESFFVSFLYRRARDRHINHVTEGHAQGGKTCLHTHFGVAKALFSYINLRVADFTWGAIPCEMFLLGAMPPVPPAGTCLQNI